MQSPQGGFRLFGPVLSYEIVRSARRGHYIALRCVFAVILLVAIFLVHESWLQLHGAVGRDGMRVIPIKRMPQFAEHVFTSFMIIQFVAVFILTPIYTAGAIAEEKDRRSLEFLFTTDLLSREIVLGKLVSSLANLFLLMLSSLPFLSLMQFLGGVDPNRVIACFVALGSTMISLGSLSILVSIYSRRPLDAIVGTYFYAALFLCCSLACPLAWIGNIFMLRLLGEGGPDAFRGYPVLPLAFGYALFHLAAAAACTAWSVRVLRPVALTAPEPQRPPEPAATLIVGAINGFGPGPATVRSRKPITDDNPMFWKERYADVSAVIGSSPLVAGFIVLLAFIVAVTMLGSFGAAMSSHRYVPREMTTFITVWGTGFSCALFSFVGLTAAGRISREREQQTLDSLFTTQLEVPEILWSKWLASLIMFRGVLWILAPIWLLGLLTEGLHPLSFLLLAMQTSIYAAFVASLGLYFSARCRSTVRATLATLVTLMSFSLLPIFVPLPSALSPPMCLVSSCFGNWRDADSTCYLLVCFLPLWCGAVKLLWGRTLSRLEAEAGRGNRPADQKYAGPGHKSLP